MGLGLQGVDELLDKLEEWSIILRLRASSNPFGDDLEALADEIQEVAEEIAEDV